MHPGGTCCRHACGVLIEQKSDGKGFELSLQADKDKDKAMPKQPRCFDWTRVVVVWWWWCSCWWCAWWLVLVLVLVLCVGVHKRTPVVPGGLNWLSGLSPLDLSG